MRLERKAAVGMIDATGWCRPVRQLMVSPYYFLKSDDLFSHRPLKSDDLFSCHLVTTPTLSYSNVVPPVFSPNSAAKNVLYGCHPLDGVT